VADVLHIDEPIAQRQIFEVRNQNSKASHTSDLALPF